MIFTFRRMYEILIKFLYNILVIITKFLGFNNMNIKYEPTNCLFGTINK